MGRRGGSAARALGRGAPRAVYLLGVRDLYEYYLISDTLFTCCILFLNNMVRHDINIDVARETVYELVGPEPELTGKLRRTHWQSPQCQWKCLLEAKLASVEMFTLR